MAIGDDAQAEGMDLVPANSPNPGEPGKVAQGNVQLNKTRDYIAQFFNLAKDYADGLFASISLSWSSITGKPSTFPPSSHGHGASAITGGTFPGASYGITGELYIGTQLFVPAAFGASSSWTVAYINGDGRLSRGTSSRRFKKNITADPVLGDLFAVPLVEYEMKDGDGTKHLGFIAEDLAANPATARFVVRDEAGEVLSYDMISFLLARTEQLHRIITDGGTP